MFKSQQQNNLGPTVKCIVLLSALVLLLSSSSSSHTAVHAVTDAGSSEIKFNSASVDNNESTDNNNNNPNPNINLPKTTQSTKTIFRVFQTLPYEPSSLSPSETMELTRKIRSTQAMIFAPSHKHYSNTDNNGVGDEGGGITSSLQEDNIELALDIYTPSERREYLVKRGNHCHPSGSSSSTSGGAGGGALNALNDNYEDTSLQWYDVLSRYDSLMSAATAANPSPEDSSTTSSKSSNFKPNSNSAELERTAIELFKYCVLYNGDGHAYWGWDEQLLLPFRDVVNVDVNYGVVATSSTPTKNNMDKNSDVVDAKTVDNVDTLSDTTSDGGSSTTTSSVGIGGPSKSYMHESFLSISPYTPATSELSSMIRFLLETSDETLSLSPLLLSQELHRLIAASKDEGNVNSNTASEAAAAAADTAGDDGSSGDDDKNNGATWTLLYNSCIPLADSESSIGIASVASNTSPEFAFADVSSSAATLLGGGASLDVHARRMAARCPRSQGGYCCLTFLPDSSNKSTGGVAGSEAGSKVAEGGPQMIPVMAFHHPVGGWTSSHDGREVGDDQKMMPYKLAGTKSSTTSPLKLGGVPESDLPYVSKVRLVRDKTKEANLPVTTKALKFPTHPADTPNFFDMLFENDCLPYRKECHRCLKDVNNEKPVSTSQDADGNEILELATENACSVCQLECPCYCDILCKVRPPPKPITRTYAVHPPAYRKEPNRLVPKIIHQTWFEPVTKDKYPNMSRLIESWKKSGWEYYFYDDETAGEFLGTHFPPEIREAYESVTPGAFKADLFRYCVLLIRGGVYADMDVFLQTNLDDAVADDIGFMTPIDEVRLRLFRQIWVVFFFICADC